MLNNIQSFNIYNIAYNCQNTPDTTDFANWLNLPTTKAAIHAPNKTYEMCNATIEMTLESELVQPPTYSILPAILDAGIQVHLYSGDYDFLVDHYGTELVIQNMTWCGKQGLQHPPNHKFVVDGKCVGNWGYEVRCFQLASFLEYLYLFIYLLTHLTDPFPTARPQLSPSPRRWAHRPVRRPRYRLRVCPRFRLDLYGLPQPRIAPFSLGRNRASGFTVSRIDSSEQ